MASKTDRDALVALFRSARGASWRKRENWDTDAALSTWFGVKVNGEGRVVQLALPDNNLQGAIPAQLGALTKLTWLNLSNNGLHGPIPKELGALSKLEQLVLSSNGLVGSIPPELGKLAALQDLDLSRNQLTGSIPKELGDLRELRELWLNSNQLTGPIPEELGKLTALEKLFLNRNNLSGPIPEKLGKLEALQYLDLEDNKLRGPIPKELGALGRLEKLQLNSNNLTGHIPPQLGDLSALTHLYLNSNKLDGSIPPDLGKLAALESLSLTSNQLTGPIPSELGNLSALETLYLSGNNLTGHIPPQLGDLSALTHLNLNSNKDLYLNSNKLDGPIPRELGNLAALQSLDLGSNTLRGHIPPQLGDLSALRHLSLNSNKLDGSIPPELGKLAALQRLYLWGNQLTGPIPPELGGLSKLEQLVLEHNKLTGRIPPELGKLAALEKLSLGQNQLSGHIPPELGALSELQYLWLKSNKLTGPIPEELGKLSAVTVLVLGSNSLSGAIPAQLGALTKLTWLKLSNNGLDGHIPPQLGDLSALTHLYLNSNKLDGPIPKELGALSKLEQLVLSSNGLTGSIPEELGKLAALRGLFLDCNNLSGPIPRELGNLAALQHLELNGNKLSVFPRLVAETFAARNKAVLTIDNPWKEPPAEVMEKGMAAAAVFLRDLDDYGRAWSNRLKVVLVGLGEAGKTSIAIRLEDRLGSSCPKPEERTVGVEIRDLKLGPGPTNEGSGPNVELDVSLWDFAGQRAYYDTHQMFLTPGALFVLVVDMFTYTEGQSREDALEQWLDILQARVPGSVVLLVGTHTDLFNDNAAECTERMGSLKKDVEKIMTRMRCECDSAKARAETELGEGHTTDLKGNPRYQPLRVVLEEDLLALDLTSSDGQDIDLLQHRLEHLAYNGYDGYSFPSVRSVVPEPYLPAIATLEAVRRGADLRGSDRTREAVAQRLREGDPKKRRSFVRFSEAVSRFSEQQEESMLSRFSKLFRRDDEPRRIFLAAVKSHEAHGAILLTGVDGGGGSQEQHNTGIGAAASAADLIIHVNPSRFADLVRRVVDVRLVDPQQQAKVEEAMEACPLVRPLLLTLTDQHERFVKAGEVSKDYLKFLWLRNMDLGEASQAAPPLEMSEAEVEVMVGSLLDVRFMYRVRDGQHAFVPDRYVVASCLPNKAGPEVDPGKILELKTGSAIYSQKLKLVGAHAVPPGLVPRLLAWCGRGEGYIKACWKRGVCFAFKNHLVLLYEVRATDGTSWIECHARGTVSDESARSALKDIGNQVHELINDHKYGFPGLGLNRSREEETVVSSDDDHKALVERIVKVLKDQMNVQFMMARSMRQDVAFRRWPIPRLVCVLPAPESGAKPLEEGDRSFEQWSATLRNWCLRGKRTGKGFATRKLRLFFLCPYDRSLAECGPGGQGYEVTELLEWAKKAMPFAKVGLALASIALRVCIGLAIPEVDFEATLGTKAGGALSTFAEELLYSGVESVASFTGERLNGSRAEGLPQGAGAHGAQQVVWPSPVQGFNYETLKEVIKSFEVDGMRGRSPFPSFDAKMHLVDRSGRGEEWAWVRTKNIDQFVGS